MICWPHHLSDNKTNTLKSLAPYLSKSLPLGHIPDSTSPHRQCPFWLLFLQRPPGSPALPTSRLFSALCAVEVNLLHRSGQSSHSSLPSPPIGGLTAITVSTAFLELSATNGHLPRSLPETEQQGHFRLPLPRLNPVLLQLLTFDTSEGDSGRRARLSVLPGN